LSPSRPKHPILKSDLSSDSAPSTGSRRSPGSAALVARMLTRRTTPRGVFMQTSELPFWFLGPTRVARLDQCRRRFCGEPVARRERDARVNTCKDHSESAESRARPAAHRRETIAAIVLTGAAQWQSTCSGPHCIHCGVSATEEAQPDQSPRAIDRNSSGSVPSFSPAPEAKQS
jgi:hypothetical protein